MSERFDSLFLAESPDSHESYRTMMQAAMDVLISRFASSAAPYSGVNPSRISLALRERPVCPETGAGMEEILDHVGRAILQHSAVVTHPACIAHLQCPPLNAALAAEVLISATNQSLDSWDQSMAATMLEQRMIAWLCGLVGYGEEADGVFTSGGSQSNFMGLLLARDHYAMAQWGWNVQKCGLPADAARMRVLCSEHAHFTVKQALALLGLGERAVVPVETDDRHRLRSDALEQAMTDLQQSGLLPFVLVATAGTTDFGSIDPLPEMAEIARRHQLWLHVDAAYGGALALSDRHASLLKGWEQADSIAVDFHKMFYQPISCGSFLLKDKRHFRYIRLMADYLNPQQDEEDGVPNLVTKSLQTTRRFDALKLYVSLQHLGRRSFGDMIDRTIMTAMETARFIRQDAALELMGEPILNAVVFRYVPTRNPDWSDEINSQIRARLLAEGTAVLARTKVDGRTCLKMTLLNPRTTPAHTGQILLKAKEIGEALETEYTRGKEIVL
ncbi:MAG: aspartate aminotransferase family protein [Brevibacillus sp.]|nr:aspartate aminotransferase family protein [Brevibacillus sp.]